MTLLLVFSSAFLSAVGNFFFKAAMKECDPNLSPMHLLVQALLQKYTFLGLSCVVTGVLFWLLAMSRTTMTYALPINIAINIIVSSALAVILLGETVSPLKLLGMFLILMGGLCVARS